MLNPFLPRSVHAWLRPSLLFLAAACVLAVAAPARAAVTTFAQFTNGGANNFVYTNNGTNATFNASSIAVQFNYSNILNLPADLTGNQAATLTLSSRTNAPAQNFGGFGVESINGSNGVTTTVNTIVITRNTAAAQGNGTRTVLLRVEFATATLSGPVPGNAATLSGSSTTSTVTFSSDFLDFSQTTQRDLGLSFSSVLPNLSINANNFFNNFTAAGTGTFSSDPVPNVVPEGDSSQALGVLVGVVGLWELLRRVRRSWSVLRREG